MLLQSQFRILFHLRKNLIVKTKLNGKKLYEKDSVKYLEIQIGKSLTWKQKIY